MSENKEKAAAAAPPAKGGGPGLVGMILPAVLAAAAAFAGAKFSGGHQAAASAAEGATERVEVKPPGPTLALDPFLLSVPDANKKVHPMKVTIAIEFEAKEKSEKAEEELRGLVPRIRDSVLAYLRTVSYEETIDPAGGAKFRGDLLEKLHAAGIPGAAHVLITDLVIQ